MNQTQIAAVKEELASHNITSVGDLANRTDILQEEASALNMTINQTIELLNQTFPNATEEVLGAFGNKIFDTPDDEINDYEGGWGSYVKTGFIILKVTLICVMMISQFQLQTAISPGDNVCLNCLHVNRSS